MMGDSTRFDFDFDVRGVLVEFISQINLRAGF